MVMNCFSNDYPLHLGADRFTHTIFTTQMERKSLYHDSLSMALIATIVRFPQSMNFMSRLFLDNKHKAMSLLISCSYDNV